MCGGRGHVPPRKFGNFFGNFKTLYQLRMCLMTSYDLNVSVRWKNIKLCPPLSPYPRRPWVEGGRRCKAEQRPACRLSEATDLSLVHWMCTNHVFFAGNELIKTSRPTHLYYRFSCVKFILNFLRF